MTDSGSLLYFRRGFLVAVLSSAVSSASAQQPCHRQNPPPTLTIPYVKTAGPLTADPASSSWAKAASTHVHHDCARRLDYQELNTDVRAFWTDTHIYFLFAAPYRKLNLFLPAQGAGDRDKLWDRDVVEIFLGADTTNINHYREFEIAPTGDHVDLAIEYERKSYDQTWNSGWETAAGIDEPRRTWYAAARIPLAAISAEPVKAGTRWRTNLYRIDGEGPDRDRRFLCWRSTCVVNRDPNHVPEAFGALVFGR
jgi:hypothetical protein